MKRDKRIRMGVLKRIEAHEYPQLAFQESYVDADGNDCVSTSGWTDEETYNIKLLIKDGLVAREWLSNAPWLEGGQSVSYVSLTSAGHDYLDSRNWFLRATRKLKSNVPTAVGSAFVAFIAFVWVLLSQVIAPESYCPLLPSTVAEWFAPCASMASEVRP